MSATDSDLLRFIRAFARAMGASEAVLCAVSAGGGASPVALSGALRGPLAGVVAAIDARGRVLRGGAEGPSDDGLPTGFFAGCPVTDHEGLRLGYLWACDANARGLRPEDATTLDVFAHLAADHLELRRSLAAAVDAAGATAPGRRALGGPFTVDLRTGEHGWSEGVWALFGEEPGAFSLTREALRARLPPGEADAFSRAVQEGAAQRRFEAVFRVIQPDGRLRDVVAQAEVLLDAEGSPARVVGEAWDLLEHQGRRAREEADRLHINALFEHNPIPLLLLEPAAGRFVGANAAAQALYGYDADTFRTLSIPDIDPGATRPARPPPRPGDPSDSFERTHRRAGGGTLDVVLTSTGVNWEGQALCLVAVQDVTEARAAERARIAAEERLRRTVDAATVGVIELDAEARVIHSNPAFAHAVERSAEEVEGRTLLDLLDLRDIPVVLPHWDALVSGAEPSFSAVIRLRSARGEPVYVHLSVSRMAVAPGRAAFAVAVAEDVDRRERAVQELSRFFDLSMDILCVADISGHYRRVNRTFAALLGLSAEAIVGRSVFDFVHPDDAEPTLQAMSVLGRGQSLSHFINRLIGAEGRVMWVEWSAQTNATNGLVYAVARDVTERRAADMARAESESRFARTLDAMTDAIIVFDDPGRVTHANAAAAALVGRPQASLSGEALAALLPAPCTGQILPLVDHAWNTCALVEGECQDASRGRWFEVRVWPTYPGFALSLRDVTARRRAAAALAEREERFAAAATVTSDGIWDLDLAADRLWLSPGVERLFGMQANATQGTGRAWWLRHIHPDDAPAFTKALDAALAGGPVPVDIAYRLRRADGTYATVEDRFTLLRDPSGAPRRALGGVTDVTAAGEAQQQLLEQATLLDHARDAIAVRRMDGEVTYCNPAAGELFGVEPEAAVGRPYAALAPLPPALGAAAEAALLATGHWEGEFALRRPDGAERRVQVRWSLVRGADGWPRRVLALHSDLTDRHELEAQLLRAQRVEGLGTLAGGIAHDLNNILAPILMSLGLVRAAVTDPADDELIEMLEASAQRGADLVGQLLTFARGASGARVLVSVGRILRDIERMVRETFPRSLRIVVDVPALLPPVSGDPTQIHQVLLNLCVNARDAMPHGGTLTLRAEAVRFEESDAERGLGLEAGDYLRLSVSDTGTGIPPTILHRIFDPFFTTKDLGNGTGLGLSTVQSIVRGHGGAVTVRSAEGAGSTFTVLLPAEAGASEADAPTARPPPRGAGELILVVDDESAILAVARAVLEGHGYRVDTASDGAEAVSLFARRPQAYALVVTDLMMPVMDGIATVAALQRIRPGVRVLACTGLEAQSTLQRLETLGVRHFLPKPMRADRLLRTVADALGHLKG